MRQQLLLRSLVLSTILSGSLCADDQGGGTHLTTAAG